MKINTSGEAISQEEIQEYINYVQEKNPDKKIAELNLKINGDYVDLSYTFENDKENNRILGWNFR